MNQNHKLARLFLATLGIASTSAVYAQPNPFYIGASQAFTRDSNLFRAPDGTAKTVDVISTTSLLGGLNKPLGRQRFYGDAALRYYNYRDNDQLNNTGYAVNVGWDWQTIERLSGTLSYTANQSQTAFGLEAPLLIAKRNTVRTQQFLASGRLGATSLLSLETIYIHRKLDYSAVEFASQEFDQDSVSLGLLYRPSGILTLGIAGRGTRGRFPAGSAVAPIGGEDKYDRSDLDLTAVWVPTGLSKVSARLSYSKEDHDRNPARDFSGVTGALSWDYKPTGKLTFKTDLIRDTGSESTFRTFTADNVVATTVGNTSQVSTAFRVRALWEFSAKVQFEASARYMERDLVTTVPPASGTDKTANASIGARWSPFRSWTFGCLVGYEKHGGSTLISGPYDANTVGCSAQLILQ